MLGNGERTMLYNVISREWRLGSNGRHTKLLGNKKKNPIGAMMMMVMLF
jgi:hypothetical protein